MSAPEKTALEPAAGAQPTGRWITSQRQRPMSLAVMLPLLRPSLPGEPDNGEDFWALVEKHCPEYRAAEREMRDARDYVPRWATTEHAIAPLA